MFIGENLTNLRTMHGYSRKQLSEKIGITEQAIWQYENSYTSPKLQVVNELKNIFNVKSKYFYTADVLAQTSPFINPVDATNIAYRSKVLNAIYKTQSEAKHIEYLDRFVDYITTKISLPTLKIINLRDEVINYLNSSNDERIIQIRQIADLARERLGFTSNGNDNLLNLIEKSGIFIFEKAIGEEIDAYSLWTKNERPYIILGNLKKSAVRRNFDIAHELGHLLLHYRLGFSSLEKKEHKVIENEANIFAGAFLLPEKEFSLDLKDISYITNPDAYIDLKRKWMVSLQVLGYRASQLKFMDSKEHRNFYASLHRKGYLKEEPLDELIQIQKPKKIKTIIDFTVKKGLLNVRQLVENDWKVEVTFLHHLTGIETAFFSSYLSSDVNFDLHDITDVASQRNKRN